MSESLVQFLQKKGTIEILCVMDHPADQEQPHNPRKRGSSFTELLEKTRIARDTLDSRLKCGTKCHYLWGPDAVADETGAAYDRYMLRPKGKKIYTILRGHRVPDVFLELREKEREYNRQCDAVVELVDEHGVDGLYHDHPDE